MKRILNSIFCVITLALFVSLTNAQDVTPKPISGGVLNGKAISLPKPSYPPEARAVRASGAVTVQVLIDENGDVVSATAVSGHPLLQAVCVEAAKAAKFSRTLLQGQPVKVSGVITYNFVGDITPTRLGFVLAHADLTQTFGAYSAPGTIARELPTQWTQERDLLNSLKFEESAVAANKVESKPPQQGSELIAASAAPDTNRFTAIGVSSAPATSGRPDAARKLDARSVASIKELMGLVEGRVSANQSVAFEYELGSLLGTFVAQVNDKTKTAATIVRIESLMEKAPAAARQSSLRSVQDFLELYKNAITRGDDMEEMITKAEMLSGLRYW